MSEWVWKPSEQYVESTNVWRFLRKLGFSDREEFLRYSRENLEQFWDAMVKETGIAWFAPYEQVLDQSRGVEWAQWFLGGKLNIAHNCLDRHVSKPNPAMIWEGENGETRTVSFADLQKETNRLANALRAIGLQKGDRIALCMPMVPEVVSILYAAFKLGVIAVPIFAGFGTHAIATRLQDSGARVVFTADSIERRGKLLPLKQKVDESIKGSSVERVVVLRYRGPSVLLPARDTTYSDLIAGQPDEFETAPLESEDRALILYTSGTTGKPKGTVHTHAGAIAQMSKEIWLAFDHQPNDRFFWLSDIGWMMGPWTIIGNHTFGGTIFLYDGAPDFPEPDRLWHLVERHRITTLGVSPTAIRMLMRKGGELAKGYAMESLRLLGSTGEPWDDTSWLWYFETVGKRRCPVINISGGTEIVGCFLFPLPIQPLKPSTLGGPAPGMAVEVVDDSGRPVRGQMGYLVCTRPAPSMTRGVWNDPQRYLDTYWSRWPGVWYHGDWASVDSDGCWYLHGRADESMNIAGRKVGPAEVEDALMQHPAVAEAAVIGVPDELRGECIVAFVVLRAEASAASLTEHLVQALGPTF
ncbi:MAG: AMP-binding protein, partial [Bryobacteraceae bacterium]|nr:AMP-binding protein [Bryobacteraceae bacterium]